MNANQYGLINKGKRKDIIGAYYGVMFSDCTNNLHITGEY